MTFNIDLEKKVITKYFDKSKQERYLQFISTPKNRHKFISDLAHSNSFKWDLLEKVEGPELKTILTTLQKNNVSTKTCYIISEDPELDGTTKDVTEAISETIGFGNGTIIVFGDAELIFYESESFNTRYISKKRL